MNAFLGVLEKHAIKKDVLIRGALTTLQVNLGNLCNQTCSHCHIEASPAGKNIMSRKVVDDILAFLRKNKVATLDITGGAPELNPNFDYFVSSARNLVSELIVRSNLTVLFEKDKEFLPEFFKTNKVHLICSMPCYTQDNVDGQRGIGVFEKSIKALQLLNEIGFSKEAGMLLDVVYNPKGAFLPGEQASLEKNYKKILSEQYGITFNRLLTITNVAINKFKKYLESNHEYERYANVLAENFNPETLSTLMCRSFLSVGHDGRLYDCDFNLAMGFALLDAEGHDLTIDKLDVKNLLGREIVTGEHCLACTAGSGSSCQGALAVGTTTGFGLAGKDNSQEMVKEYYGKILQNKNDLKTSACCAVDSFVEPLKSIIKNIEPEILDKFYGCGSPIPPLLEGASVLDLGCGTGRDVYLVSALVGEAGRSIGIDMTDEQLAIARKHQDRQMKRFGFKKRNVDFKKGYIEDLKSAGLADNSIDVVISNCVINLSPDKTSVFTEIFRVLKPGGELYFSDVFADRRIPVAVKNDPVLYGECLGGAMYIEDFRRTLRNVGCLDYRVTAQRKLAITDVKLADKLGAINFYSMTIRAFKFSDLEDICEDYGQVANYLGTIPFCPHEFTLDDHHVFTAHKPYLVCGNTAAMLSKTRYAKHFKVTGDTSRHFGAFPCGPAEKAEDETAARNSSGCC